jgi:hypothetical protein
MNSAIERPTVELCDPRMEPNVRLEAMSEVFPPTNQSCGRKRPISQARATFQSRFTVIAETFKTSATS